ncbi:hypothetical protein CIW48_15390 [Methylobacterium sp. P1-11]|nr:hypothetical protein CIW48_15390 [Methylobacterium sp. P1-11]
MPQLHNHTASVLFAAAISIAGGVVALALYPDRIVDVGRLSGLRIARLKSAQRAAPVAIDGPA